MNHILRVRTQAEVAHILGCSQKTVNRLERRAFRKLRADPEAKLLLHYICQHNSQGSADVIEPAILRKLGNVADASFLTISGFAPNL